MAAYSQESLERTLPRSSAISRPSSFAAVIAELVKVIENLRNSQVESCRT